MNGRAKVALALAVVASVAISALLLTLPSGVVGGRSNTLRYALVPYRISGANLLGAAFASGTVAADLRRAWSSVFNGSPKLLLGFYKGNGNYVLAVVGNAWIVARKCGRSTYDIELLATKVALTYTNTEGGNASKLLKKLNPGKLLKVLSPPVRVFSNVLIYESIKLISRVRVDNKGFMYLGSTFLGTWPFNLPKSGRILWVVPHVYCANLRNAAGVVLPYHTLRNGSVVLAVPGTAQSGSVTSSATPAGGKAPKTAVIEVGGHRYVAVIKVSPALTPYVMGYDPSTGVLKWMNVSRAAVRADGWEIPVMYFSVMLPAPLPLALGPRAYIAVVPLGNCNAVKLVLSGTPT